jgi:predicted nucleotide-binding protein (sugar kinase/HSP70/actin superfamily)
MRTGQAYCSFPKNCFPPRIKHPYRAHSRMAFFRRGWDNIFSSTVIVWQSNEISVEQTGYLNRYNYTRYILFTERSLQSLRETGISQVPIRAR